MFSAAYHPPTGYAIATSESIEWPSNELVSSNMLGGEIAGAFHNKRMPIIRVEIYCYSEAPYYASNCPPDIYFYPSQTVSGAAPTDNDTLPNTATPYFNGGGPNTSASESYPQLAAAPGESRPTPNNLDETNLVSNCS